MVLPWFLMSSNLLLARLDLLVVGAVVAANHHCDLVINVAENGKAGACEPPIPAYENNLSKISCPNVSSAFDYISMISDNVTVKNCVHINVSSGDHIFTQPQNLSINLLLTGTSSTVIHCAYNSSSQSNFTAANLLYTLFFVRVGFVKFEMVQFEKCKQPFRLEEVSNVSIVNSYFTQFTDAVLDLYNCIHVNIDNCTFINNTGRGTVFLPLRGNTGAVSIGYYNSDNFDNTTPTVSITDCHFINNDAAVEDDTFSTSSTAFLLNRFTGRGGSLAILMNLTAVDLNASINRCMFKQNHAVSFGGALYLLFSGRELHHMIIIEDCLFMNNFADNGAGAIQITFNRAEVLSGQPMTVIIHNCNFTGNSAVIGGAVFLFPSLEGEEGNLLVIEDCYFYNNHANDTGGAVTASQFAFFIPKDKLINHRITNW